MAGMQTKDPLGVSHIHWQDVYTFDMPKGNSSLLDNTIPMIPADRQKVIEALEKIEKTENGQLLFQSLLAKQHNLDYAEGQYLNQKISLVYDMDSNGVGANIENNGVKAIKINREGIDKLAIITPSGHYDKQGLDEVLFHESVHASDQSAYAYGKTVKEWAEAKSITGIQLRSQLSEFKLSTPDETFRASLPKNIVDAVIAIDNSEHDSKRSQAEKDALYAEKLPILLQNKEISHLFHLTQQMVQGRFNAEDLAVDRANAYRAEITGGNGEARGAYGQGIVTEKVEFLPVGRVENLTLNPQEKVLNTEIQKEWTQEHGPPVISSKSELLNFNPVPIPVHMQKLLLDIPLSPLLKNTMQDIPHPVSLAPSQVVNTHTQNNTRTL